MTENRELHELLWEYFVNIYFQCSDFAVHSEHRPSHQPQPLQYRYTSIHYTVYTVLNS